MARKALTKFKMNSKGIERLLKSSRVEAELFRRAQNTAAAAGPGFEAESSVGRNRARADVFPETHEARSAESRDAALTRAIDASRR